MYLARITARQVLLDRWLHHIAEDQFHVWVEAAHDAALAAVAAAQRRSSSAWVRRIQRSGLGAYDKTWMGVFCGPILLSWKTRAWARVGPLGEGPAQSFQIAFTDFVRADECCCAGRASGRIF